MPRTTRLKCGFPYLMLSQIVSHRKTYRFVLLQWHVNKFVPLPRLHLLSSWVDPTSLHAVNLIRSKSSAAFVAAAPAFRERLKLSQAPRTALASCWRADKVITASMQDVFAVPVFFIVFRETLETSIVVSVLLAFIKQQLGPDQDKSLYKKLRKQVCSSTLPG